MQPRERKNNRAVAQCHLVFGQAVFCTNCGADPPVRGRPPGRPADGCSRLILREKSGSGGPARTRGSAPRIMQMPDIGKTKWHCARLRAAPTLLSTRFQSGRSCRQDCRHGTQECDTAGVRAPPASCHAAYGKSCTRRFYNQVPAAMPDFVGPASSGRHSVRLDDANLIGKLAGKFEIHGEIFSTGAASDAQPHYIYTGT